MSDHENVPAWRPIVRAMIELALLAVAAVVWWGAIDWPGVARWVADHAVVLVLAATAAMLLGHAAADLARRRLRHPTRTRLARPPLSWWAVAAGAVLIAAVGWGATVWLLGEADRATPEAQAPARVEAIKTGLGIAAGTGGILALMLAVRRQWHQEHTAQVTEHDATERRITELYVKAIEQLGSDKTAIRHGGLYALERLAQNNPGQRQTIVDVICAYLRAPHVPPTRPHAPAAAAPALSRRHGIRRPLLTNRTPGARPAPSDTAGATTATAQDATLEQEVRLTAQHILQRHLAPGTDPRHPVSTFWPDLDLDLTGAHLVDLDVTGAHLHTVTLTGAHLTGSTRFGGVSFAGDARFSGVSFGGHAQFSGARFAGLAQFGEARFAEEVRFDDATFAKRATFSGASFVRDAWFGADFAEEVWFGGVSFGGHALFSGASFTERVTFDGASFAGDARFDRISFGGHAQFSEARFAKNAWFHQASFAGIAAFHRATFTGDAIFREVTFREEVPEEVARFVTEGHPGTYPFP